MIPIFDIDEITVSLAKQELGAVDVIPSSLPSVGFSAPISDARYIPVYITCIPDSDDEDDEDEYDLDIYDVRSSLLSSLQGMPGFNLDLVRSHCFAVNYSLEDRFTCEAGHFILFQVPWLDPYYETAYDLFGSYAGAEIHPEDAPSELQNSGFTHFSLMPIETQRVQNDLYVLIYW